jgi:hypothetical protein
MAGMRTNRFPDAPAKPIIARPEDLIIVVRGFGRHSSWLPTFGESTLALRRPVCRVDGTPVRAIADLTM